MKESYATVRREVLVDLLDLAVVPLEVCPCEHHVFLLLDEALISPQREVAFETVLHVQVSVLLILSEDRVVEVPFPPGLLVLWRNVLLSRSSRSACTVCVEIVIEEWFISEIEIEKVELGQIELILRFKEFESLISRVYDGLFSRKIHNRQVSMSDKLLVDEEAEEDLHLWDHDTHLSLLIHKRHEHQLVVLVLQQQKDRLTVRYTY